MLYSSENILMAAGQKPMQEISSTRVGIELVIRTVNTQIWNFGFEYLESGR